MYKVGFAKISPEMKGLWDGPAWMRAETLELVHFRPEGGGHRPKTAARLLYNMDGIFGIFRVEDRYVRCVRTRYGELVYKDSCVEFFVKPKTGKGYFNFEFNCGGALLCSYIVNPERTAEGFKEFVPIPEEEASCVTVRHSLPGMVEPEITGPVVWMLEYFIPFALLERYAGPLGDVCGQEWNANFYKCGDETSHPHWASWQPVPELNFHMPECFGTMEFADQ
ncbi:MAG TPA: carbohydrate-binding family 9-like protein [Dissulfurispiraceae bacterium]|nr:carbohydrate-binding family 9-like protein [Dissulfurispiraceae bacterium]